MPPSPSSTKGKHKLTLTSDSTPLALPALLKLLTSSGAKPPHLSMSQAMQAAAKLVPNGYTSPAKLRTLTQVEMARIGIADEDVRKGLMGAIGKAEGKGKAKAAVFGDEGGFKRKRGRESDLDRPLPTSAAKEAVVEQDLDFDEIEVEEGLVSKSCIVNRAPVMTAWACIVAERLGFRRQEALSIAHVFTDLNATAKGISLGLKSKEERKVELGSSQPFVEILGRRVPVLATQSGEWRAISKGVVADPSTGFSYMQRAFRQQLGAVVGAMRLLANSFDPNELNEKGYGLYLSFRPDVDGWGKKAELRLSTILNLRRFLTHPEPVVQPEPEINVDEGKGGRPVNAEDGWRRVVKVETAEDSEPAAKKVKVDDGEDVKPSLSDMDDEKDEFDALLDDDDGIDFGAIDA
ncbi:hypothetical protein JCM1841_005320 [Sporobolomyces salmonicolor]